DLLLHCARTNALPRRTFDPEPVPAIATALIAAFGTKAKRDALAVTLPFAGGGKTYGPSWIETMGEALAGIDADTPPARMIAAFNAFRDKGSKLLPYLAKPPPHQPIARALAAALATTTIAEAIATALLPHV